MSELLLDAAGRRRSPATLPEFHAGRPPRNKGMRYPADPPTIEEIVTVMRRAGDRVHGRRLRGLIVVLWRAGLRIHEALALAEADLDPRRGSLLVRRGKGGRRREVGMDDWAWEQLEPWLQARVELPVGPLFCVVNGADARAAVGGRRRPLGAAPRRPRGRRAPPLRAAPAAPRARGRDGARGRAADRHPAPARAHQPRHHLDLPPGHRQHRDHRHRPRPPRPDGPRPQLAAHLKAARPAAGSGVPAAGPRPTQQRADAPSGAPGLLLCQEAGVSPGAPPHRPRRASAEPSSEAPLHCAVRAPRDPRRRGATVDWELRVATARKWSSAFDAVCGACHGGSWFGPASTSA